MPRNDDRYGGTRLYVGRLSSRTRPRDLEDLFSRYGRVRDVDMKRDYAFIEFSDPRDADDARYSLDGREFDGSRMIVEFARGGPRGSRGSREYLGRGPPPGSGRCFNCGTDGHWARDCKAGDWKNKCYRCGERGHVERNCQNSPKNLRHKQSYSRSPTPRRGRSRSPSYSRSRSYSLTVSHAQLIHVLIRSNQGGPIFGRRKDLEPAGSTTLFLSLFIKGTAGDDAESDDDDGGWKRNKAVAEMAIQEEGAFEHKAYARIGLLGNPSDVYFGRTISFSLGNFWASVRLEPSDDLVIQPHPTHDNVSFTSIHHLVSRLQSEGYYGGVRLLMAVCKVFYNHCTNNNIKLKEGNFTLSYDTNIPRQTGLSGSSAIVCAALHCLLDFYGIRHLVKVEIRPGLILSAEKELGIVAGLQDRVAQVYGGLVYMDFSKEYMDKSGHGMYTPMDISLLPPLHLIYAENPSDSGKVHSTVRQRWLEGDKFIISLMEEVAELAVEGRNALLEKNYIKLADLMNRNFEIRRQMFGDDVLGSLNIQMVEVARSVGAASKFTGSGGAVVAFCPDGPDQAKLLEEACQKAGFILQQAIVVPPVLNEEDMKTLSS